MILREIKNVNPGYDRLIPKGWVVVLGIPISLLNDNMDSIIGKEH